MANAIAQTTYRKDYRVADFLIADTYLEFDLRADKTLVRSRLSMHRNPLAENPSRQLILDGQDLELLSLAINGRTLTADEYRVDAQSLCIFSVPEAFELRCETAIDPANNTSLEGLYRSRSMYCTQCEAEGFRKITYYLDRPDVLSEFTTTLVANAGEFATLLSNGNCIADTTLDGVRRVSWHDPFKKPCYLFALVAGNLSMLSDSFTTMNGREVAIHIYVEAKDLDKCEHAMDSLKRAMRWDEDVYGREYDLDIFMIVAVDDFNMGAMENKGLNIFNTSCVLAHPKTTTDAGFQRVEAVVAHEYFHNWSGNRVTCRDWFQLSLKEGFTVYRDAEFSADMNSRAVKRIEDVSLLRAHQFAEDAGPMAHSVRPDAFMEISNFYTLTIYEKGAEVVRMIANILGEKAFRMACDLYFERFDGMAVTCEDFVATMEESSGINLQQFRLWYEQAGTPALALSGKYDKESKSYTLNVRQSLPDTPGQKNKKAMHIPLKMALLGFDGAVELHIAEADSAALSHSLSADKKEVVLAVTEFEQNFIFSNIQEAVLPSLLRGFSAPVYISYPYTAAELARLMVVDSDGFSRFDAAQQLAMNLLNSLLQGNAVESAELQQYYLQALAAILADATMDNALKALMLQLPAQSYLLEQQAQAADPAAIHAVHTQLQHSIAKQFEAQWLACYQQLGALCSGLGAEAIAARRLRNVALMYLLLLDDTHQNLAVNQFQQADNMTEQSAALRCLVNNSQCQLAATDALAAFYQQFKDESLVVNLWLQIQAGRDTDEVLGQVQALMQHEAFDMNNPNKLRALISGFSQNSLGFHKADGSGYDFLASIVMQLNAKNPQVASRLLAPLTRWRKIEAGRAALMQQALARIAAMDDLSKDVYEVVTKSLAQ